MVGLSKAFKHTRRHNTAILDLLVNTKIGTNGAQYTHLHTPLKIGLLHQPHFFTIYRKEKAIVNFTICERPFYVQERLIDTFYVRYFAFDKNFQTQSKANKKGKPSPFQQYFSKLLSTSNLQVAAPAYGPSLYWAIIDPENIRSLQVAERYQFESIAKIKTWAFSRIYLKKDKKVTRILAHEHDEVWACIQNFYRSYSGLSKVHLFEANHYFVYREDGKIVAGIQANPVAWKIHSLPGKNGKKLVKILPYLPFISRLMHPNKFNFLATEGIFWLPNHADKVKKLLQGVLALQQCHTMMLWTDAKDERLNKQIAVCKPGLLQKFKADQEVDLWMKFNHISPDLKSSIKNALQYISGFDTT
ncbi:hypothetical protein [Putridiphycobacter roseus]|uniref:hypothetical protein n=1 Tax=Putridiphycobacter roseus TaxID=2219161 RepID=UPI0011B65941|nr:hypothetical protein [Putridiphycobacter roseus]